MMKHKFFVISFLASIYSSFIVFWFMVCNRPEYSLWKSMNTRDSDNARELLWNELSKAVHNVTEIDKKLTCHVEYLKKIHTKFFGRNEVEENIESSYDYEDWGLQEDESENFYNNINEIFLLAGNLHKVSKYLARIFIRFGVHHKLGMNNSYKILNERIQHNLGKDVDDLCSMYGLENNEYGKHNLTDEIRSKNHTSAREEFIELIRIDEVITNTSKTLIQKMKHIKHKIVTFRP